MKGRNVLIDDKEDGSASELTNANRRDPKATPRQAPRDLSWSDPVPHAQWEVLYWDMFDREAPPTIDTKGRGLARGLMELWARFLGETVQPSGRQGFSRFTFKWDRGPVGISGSSEGATRLRGWAFGDKERFTKGYVGESDAFLLQMVATAHAYLLLDGASSEAILEAAQVAADRGEFEARLALVAYSAD